MKLTRNASIILASRYLRKDASGTPSETPDDMFRRVAQNVALADALYTHRKQIAALLRRSRKPFPLLTRTKEFRQVIKNDAGVKASAAAFHRIMTDLDFLPNSPTLFNAGRELQQLAGCFVLPIEDSMDGIFTALRQTALIHQSGGGTGFSFSRLRPRGDTVRSTQGVASGPVSFMKIFDAATEQIKQGGKRRGANMGVLRVDHPDIEEFTTAKLDPAVLTNFNISVAITDRFMKAVARNTDYPLIHPRTGKVVGRKHARSILRLICSSVWASGDPGVIFIDTINKKQPTPCIGAIESTNPCGEVPLLPYEACNLGSINLAHFVRNGAIDYPRLRGVVWQAVHFLDNVIDMSIYPFPQISAMVQGNRKIGLGVMGFADMLFDLGVGYATPQGLRIAEDLMMFIDEEAKMASVALARQRGVFPNFAGSVYDAGRTEDRVRNATRTSIAPTGTLSLIAGCSSGIEPVFALAFTHTVLETRGLLDVNQPLLRVARARGFHTKKFLRQLSSRGTLKGMAVPADIKKIFVTSHDVPADYHVKMQAAFQRHTDNAVSKTVNLKANATVKDIRRIYMLAYSLGCKGISIYRDTSKAGQVLIAGQKECLFC